ncbi:MAG: hypothetical protein KY429_00700 [Actinobacteria bacterium]|nr:hypothetical protein [Actinomycetota bacterium]
MSHPKSELAEDIEAMVEAITTSLISNYGEAIAGLWLKGSAVKPWGSPIDYVPEISDVDIHYRPREEQGSELYDLHTAVRVHAEIARQFEKARPRALHTPRPQLVSLPHVEQLAGYIPSPPGTVRTLFGEAPSRVHIDPKAVIAADSRNLIEAGDPRVLEKEIVDLVERPGHYLFTGLRNLNWRLSPVASRALSVLGIDYDVAWSVNRTNAIELLRENGQDELATYYSSYYLAAWEFFLSKWKDGDAGRSAFSAAVRALRLGAELGRSRLGL